MNSTHDPSPKKPNISLIIKSLRLNYIYLVIAYLFVFAMTVSDTYANEGSLSFSLILDSISTAIANLIVFWLVLFLIGIAGIAVMQTFTLWLLKHRVRKVWARLALSSIAAVALLFGLVSLSIWPWWLALFGVLGEAIKIFMILSVFEGMPLAEQGG